MDRGRAWVGNGSTSWSSGAGRPVGCWPTGSVPTRPTVCCCWRRGVPTACGTHGPHAGGVGFPVGSPVRLALRVRARAAHARPPHAPSARQADRRVQQHQRDGLPARPPGGLERWGADAGMGEWDYAHCLPYFKRLESSAVGSAGPCAATGARSGSSAARSPGRCSLRFFAPPLQAGHRLAADLNGADAEGFGAVGTHDPPRPSAFGGPGVPAPGGRPAQPEGALARPGHPGPGPRATGRSACATRSGSGRTVEVTAGEVVLAGGAFNSPQLLQLSGIGNPGDLAAVGVRVGARPTGRRATT